jgi:hypothetical protein
MKRAFGIGVVLLSLVGCASAPRYHGPSEEELAEISANRYVDERMAETVASIDRSLQTLVILERGAEAPRLPTPLGDTVAGEAGPKPRIPAPGDPARTNPAHTKDVLAQSGSDPSAPSQSNPAPLATELDVRLEISWNGPWEGLVQEVARALRFRYVEKNKGTLGSGTWSTTGASARQVLESVANRVKGKAEIRVILRDKTIEVVYP